MSYIARHIAIRDASAFVGLHHRHHQPPQGCIAAVAAWSGGTLAAVAMLGRPVARALDDGDTAEIVRVCAAPGHRNACSFILQRAKRLAQAWGFSRVVTYTLPYEGGASLRGAGFRLDGTTPGRSWSVPSRTRTDTHPLGEKLRWVA